MSKCPDNYWWDININVSFLTCREVMVTEEPVLSWFQNFRNFTNLFQSFPFWMENWSDFSSWENHFSLNFLSCHCDKDILTNCGEKKETWLYCNGHLMYFSIFSLLLLFFFFSSCKLYFSYIVKHDRWWKIWKKVIMLVDLAPGGWWDLEGKATQTFYLGITQTAFELVKRPDNGWSGSTERNIIFPKYANIK